MLVLPVKVGEKITINDAAGNVIAEFRVDELRAHGVRVAVVADPAFEVLRPGHPVFSLPRAQRPTFVRSAAR